MMPVTRHGCENKTYCLHSPPYLCHILLRLTFAGHTSSNSGPLRMLGGARHGVVVPHVLDSLTVSGSHPRVVKK